LHINVQVPLLSDALMAFKLFALITK
jgi:hypothetical protein